MSKIVFLWDIDGTILLSGGAGLASFNRVFEELYHEKYIWGDISPDGKTDDQIINELFMARFNKLPTPTELQHIAQKYIECMEEEIQRSTRFRLMPHVVEVIEKLSADKRFSLGLATGNYEPAAWAKLRRAQMDSHFHYGGFGSDSPIRQELTHKAKQRAVDYLKAEPQQLFVVGDTVHDIRCGQGIGAKTVGVCTGSTSAETLKSAGADFVLQDLTQFDDVLKTLGGS